MTVTGEPGRPGEVHHEGMSVIGPKVVIDQLRNKLAVEGAGSLVMPAGSPLRRRAPEGAAAGEGGGPAAAPAGHHPLARRHGLRGGAEVGRVHRPGEGHPGRVVRRVPHDAGAVRQAGRCSTRPAEAGPAPARGPTPKIDRVHCYPAPGDAPDEPAGPHEVNYTEVVRDPTGRLIKWQFLKGRPSN